MCIQGMMVNMYNLALVTTHEQAKNWLLILGSNLAMLAYRSQCESVDGFGNAVLIIRRYNMVDHLLPRSISRQTSEHLLNASIFGFWLQRLIRNVCVVKYLHGRDGIVHCYTYSRKLKHLQVILTISYGHHLALVYIQVF